MRTLVLKEIREWRICCFQSHKRTEILLITTMPIYIFLKQLITCQEDTQSFRTAITHFYVFILVTQLPWLQLEKIQQNLHLITTYQYEFDSELQQSTPAYITKIENENGRESILPNHLSKRYYMYTNFKDPLCSSL